MNKEIKKLSAVFIGEFICALAITFFFIPHKLLSGGVGGIGIMLEYLTDISSGIFMFVINIPLFIFGFIKLKNNFMIHTFISATILSLYLFLLKMFKTDFMIHDIFLSSVFGGAINGIGMGLLFRNSASQGGLDILALIAKKTWNINISSALMAMNFIIISIASALFGIEKGMYTIVSMYVAYHVMDVVINGFDDKKQIIIISDKSSEISDKIMSEIHRGVTLLDARGAYTGNVKEVIYCVVNNRQIIQVKEIVNSTDATAFMSISNMTEVKGKGFISADEN